MLLLLQAAACREEAALVVQEVAAERQAHCAELADVNSRQAGVVKTMMQVLLFAKHPCMFCMPRHPCRYIPRTWPCEHLAYDDFAMMVTLASENATWH